MCIVYNVANQLITLLCVVVVLSLALYRKIVSFILLQSGLGSPTDIAVVREATGKLLTILTCI